MLMQGARHKVFPEVRVDPCALRGPGRKPNAMLGSRPVLPDHGLPVTDEPWNPLDAAAQTQSQAK